MVRPVFSDEFSIDPLHDSDLSCELMGAVAGLGGTRTPVHRAEYAPGNSCEGLVTSATRPLGSMRFTAGELLSVSWLESATRCEAVLAGLVRAAPPERGPSQDRQPDAFDVGYFSLRETLLNTIHHVRVAKAFRCSCLREHLRFVASGPTTAMVFGSCFSGRRPFSFLADDRLCAIRSAELATRAECHCRQAIFEYGFGREDRTCPAGNGW
jgi:hypothetical protein